MTQPPSNGDQQPYGDSQQPQYGGPQQPYGEAQPPPYGEQQQPPPYGEQQQPPQYGEQQQYGGQQPQYGEPQQQPYGATQSASGQGPDSAGFFKALFDFSFKSFVTVRFAAVIYGIALVAIGVGALVGVIFSFATMSQSVVGGLLSLVVVAIAAPIYLIVIRVTLEFYVAMIRTAQNTGQTNAELNSLRWEMSQRR